MAVLCRCLRLSSPDSKQLQGWKRCCLLQSGIFGTGHFYALGNSISSQLDAAQSTDASDRKAWLIIAYIMAACTAILILLTLLMMRRVKVSSAEMEMPPLADMQRSATVATTKSVKAA